MIRGIARKYFEGKTCIFCGKYGLYKLKDKRVKCKHCNKKYSLVKLKKDLQILYYFYLEISARRAAKELQLNYKLIHRKFMQFRKAIADYCNREAKKLNGELENAKIILTHGLNFSWGPRTLGSNPQKFIEAEVWGALNYVFFGSVNTLIL